MSPALIIAAIEAAMKLIDWVNKVRANNAVTSAWTPAERAEVDTKWDALMSSPEWQTDADKGV